MDKTLTLLALAFYTCVTDDYTSFCCVTIKEYLSLRHTRQLEYYRLYTLLEVEDVVCQPRIYKKFTVSQCKFPKPFFPSFFIRLASKFYQRFCARYHTITKECDPKGRSQRDEKGEGANQSEQSLTPHSPTVSKTSSPL